MSSMENEAVPLEPMPVTTAAEAEQGADNGGDLARVLSPREAFAMKDPKMSRIAHQMSQRAVDKEPHNVGTGQFMKSIIFGGLDGIITTFAVVASVYGADLSTRVVLVLGFSNLIGDGISMGFGDYLSSKAEREYIMTERAREEWEMVHYPQGEKQEMIDIYIKNGFSADAARQAIEILSTNQKWFVDHMMVQELGMMVPDDEDSSAKEGLVTFLSFMSFGFIPLIAYCAFKPDQRQEAFIVSCVLTGVCLFLLGVVKGKIAVGSQHLLLSGFYVLINGLLAAVAAFFTGWGIGTLANVSNNCSV